ncbi:MAG: hypothetical protein QW478_10115 [Candidatus Micrarchaeaceae archaeon]
MELKEYYASLDPKELWLPSFPHWTQFRFSLDANLISMRKIKDVINTRADLLFYLRKYAPYHVFYMTSKFLDATVVNKKGNKLSQNLFLFSDEIVLDIDRDTIEESKQAAYDLVKYLKKVNMLPYMVVFSGKKGFHLHLPFGCRSGSDSPAEREQDTLLCKKAIIENIEEDTGIKIDSVAGWNTRGIIRLPGTIHGKTGNLVEKIGIEDIKGYEPKRIVDVKKEIKFKEFV